MTLKLPLLNREQSQDKWMLRMEGVIWSSEQEIPEEMGRGCEVRTRNTDGVTGLRELGHGSRDMGAIGRDAPQLSSSCCSGQESSSITQFWDPTERKLPEVWDPGNLLHLKSP